MKITNFKASKTILILSFLLVTAISSAQLPPPFDESQDDTSPAPISSLVALGLIAGAVYGIRKMK
ncbi:hypothetical protein [Mesohalobacter halotolerans]|uniref:PEP-CTERM sorting domain-containing protein n=1 Tax=Mesohalobacter halotolerans TaxID=1883405 RepID=A0A4U5TUF8_9FLAO|nr:hypothetical protein [Mesohalobacter halotolerans]TKS57571.1 hypothetical protein FCN74_03910 [Mesohalobacter halotolerans]